MKKTIYIVVASFIMLCMMSCSKEDVIRYDAEGPTHIRVPELLETPGDYNPADKYTFPIYGGFQTVKEPELGNVMSRYAIWCTKEATYLTTITQQYWDLHYHQQRHEDYIRDSKTGEKYHVIEALGLPMDTSYNVKGVCGTWICTVLKYPPLPKTCTVIDIIEGEVSDVVENGLGWSDAPAIRNITISQLQTNQQFTELKEVKVIE